MMSDAVILALAALVLGYASLLLYLRLSLQGMRRARIARVLVELWGAFLLIIGLFALARSVLGPVPPGVDIPREFAMRLSQFLALPPAQQALIILLALAAVALFFHAIWSMNDTQRRLTRTAEHDRGDNHDSTTETRPDLD